MVGWRCALPCRQLDSFGHQKNQEPPPRLADIPSAIKEIVLRALAIDPKDRFASVLDFAATLEQARQEGTIYFQPTLKKPSAPSPQSTTIPVPPTVTAPAPPQTLATPPLPRSASATLATALGGRQQTLYPPPTLPATTRPLTPQPVPIAPPAPRLDLSQGRQSQIRRLVVSILSAE